MAFIRHRHRIRARLTPSATATSPAASRPQPIFADRAHGARLTDVDGREYIDFVGGIGVLNRGHTPDAVVEAIREQAGSLLHHASRSRCTSPTSRSASMLCELHARRLRQEGAADQLRRRGGRERHQDRPLLHRPRRRDHLRPRLPRPHAADHVADLEAGLQEGHRPVRARRSTARRRRIRTAASAPRTRWTASTSVQGHVDPASVACDHLRAGAGRGRLPVVPPGFIRELEELCRSTASSTSTTRCSPAWAAPASCWRSSTPAWCPT